MTTELMELADRPEFTVDEALRIADQNADSYEKVASVSRTLAAEVRRLRALASRAGGWISVKDRLPGACDHVEVYPDPRDDTYCFYAVHEGGTNGVKAGRWYFNDRDGYDNEIKVTHWRYERAAPEPVGVG